MQDKLSFSKRFWNQWKITLIWVSVVGLNIWQQWSWKCPSSTATANANGTPSTTRVESTFHIRWSYTTFSAHQHIGSWSVRYVARKLRRHLKIQSTRTTPPQSTLPTTGLESELNICWAWATWNAHQQIWFTHFSPRATLLFVVSAFFASICVKMNVMLFSGRVRRCERPRYLRVDSGPSSS